MFDDIEDFVAQDGRQRRRYCGFSRWAQGLSATDRARAEELVADEQYNCRSLARYFQSKGATFNDQVINRHRLGHCCGQAG